MTKLSSIENPRFSVVSFLRQRGPAWFWLAMALGLLIRVAIVTQTARFGTEIIDEQHYRQIAENILAGNGFAWGPGRPTSIRPPLYPGLLALVWNVTGGVNLQAVRLLQIVLAALTTFLVHRTAHRLFGERSARIAAAIFWLYPSFIFFNVLILTETLFTFLLVAFVLSAVALLTSDRNWRLSLLCGVCLGLAALTRSVLWPLPLVLCPLLVLLVRGTWRWRVTAAALVFTGYAIVIMPWAVRNTQLQRVVTVVDTMGGLNLRMGNYEYTPDDRMWDAVALQGPRSWSWELAVSGRGARMTEGEKDKWAQQQALAYIREHPDTFIRRTLIKFSDFWGLEREFVAGVGRGMYAPPKAVVIAAAALIGVSYPVVAVLGIVGLWTVLPQDRRAHVVMVLPFVVIMGVHTVVFGHSRYHLPLVPILAIYAAALLTQARFTLVRLERPQLIAAAVTCAALVLIWVRQLAFTDLERLRALLHHV